MTQEIEAISQDQAAEQIGDLNIDGLLGIGDDTPEEQQAEPAQADEVNEVDEIEEVEESEDSDEPAESEEETEDEEEASIETFADLATALDQSSEELEATLTTKIKVDGVESDVTLAELKNGYQREKDYTQKTMALAEKGREHEAQHAQVIEQVQAQAQIAGAVLQEVNRLFAGEQDRIFELMQTDPQMGLVEKAKYDQKIQQLQNIQQAAASNYEAFVNQNTSTATTKRSELEATEREKLAAAIPDLTQEKATNLAKYLTETHGFSPDVLNNTLDHKFFVLANKAMQFDTQTAKAEPAKKRVKNLPKLQPNAKKKVSAPRSQLQKAKRRLSQSKSVEDAAAAIQLIPGIDKQMGFR